MPPQTAGLRQASMDSKSANSFLGIKYITLQEECINEQGCFIEEVLEHGEMRERVDETPKFIEECFVEGCDFEEVAEYPNVGLAFAFQCLTLFKNI